MHWNRILSWQEILDLYNAGPNADPYKVVPKVKKTNEEKGKLK